MDDKVVLGLFSAAVAAVTFVAYKHHEVYWKLAVTLWVASALVLVVGMVWDSGVHKGAHDVARLLEDKEKAEQAMRAVKEGKLLPDKVMFFWLASNAYLLFLLFLPNLGITAAREKKGD